MRPVTIECGTCGELVAVASTGRIPSFCGDVCRKISYAASCLDCGKRLSGSDGRGQHAPKRCVQCNGRAVAEARRMWTRETLIAAIQRWAAEYGEPPAIPDWSPYAAREINDPERAERWKQGGWPSAHSAYHVFGPSGWTKAIEAAGFVARPKHGGAENVARRRPRVPLVDIDAVVRCYAEGQTSRAVADEYGVCAQSVIRWARDRGVPIRPRGRHRREFQVAA